MPRKLSRLWKRVSPLSLALVLVALLWPAPSVAGPGEQASTSLINTPVRSVYVRVPHGGTAPDKPLQVLLALHGMGANGEDFARDLSEQADRYGWLIVAPTIAYGDWMNPTVVAREDPILIHALAEYVDQLPQLTGYPIRRQLLVLGHSRGAQLAHRYAEFYPDNVLALAILSAGDYTMPSTNGSFPFGVKDLAEYAGRAFDASRFVGMKLWVGVGSQDTNPSDVPRQWDAYEGNTRVLRAQAFEAAMRKVGASVVLHVFGNAKHEVTGKMRSAACAFLNRATHTPAAYAGPPTALPHAI